MAATLPPAPRAGKPLVHARPGDLHLADAEARHYLDFLVLLVQRAAAGGGRLDFICWPGDVADNGRPEQRRRVAAALRPASAPVHAISGAHDVEPGSLAAFCAGLGPLRCPGATQTP